MNWGNNKLQFKLLWKDVYSEFKQNQNHDFDYIVKSNKHEMNKNGAPKEVAV